MTEPCPACGEDVEWGAPPDGPDVEGPDGEWACSPCRAERAGALWLRLPVGADPRGVAVMAGYPPLRPGLGDPVQMLRDWADALEAAAAAVRALAAEVAETDEAAVARTVMGAERAVRLAPDGDGELLLVGLEPAEARRLARLPTADGPHLSAGEIREITGTGGRRV